jgi:hypothetical protein
MMTVTPSFKAKTKGTQKVTNSEINSKTIVYYNVS